MRHLLSTTLFVLATSLFASSPRAQICAPTPPPSGQPALMPFTPACGGLLPPPVVWALGNPGFTLSSFAPPPVPPGSPTVLMVGLPAPPLPIPAPPLAPFFGAPGFFNQINLIAVPAGPSGPLPGLPVPFPIAPTGGPIGVINVHTVVLIPGALVVALTGATDVTI